MVHRIPYLFGLVHASGAHRAYKMKKADARAINASGEGGGDIELGRKDDVKVKVASGRQQRGVSVDSEATLTNI